MAKPSEQVGIRFMAGSLSVLLLLCMVVTAWAVLTPSPVLLRLPAHQLEAMTVEQERGTRLVWCATTPVPIGARGGRPRDGYVCHNIARLPFTVRSAAAPVETVP